MSCYVCGRPCFGNEMTPTADGPQSTCSDVCAIAAQMGDFRWHKAGVDPHKYWYNREERFLLYRWLMNRRKLSHCVASQVNGSFLLIRVFNKKGLWIESCFSTVELWRLSFGWRTKVAREIKLMRSRLR